MGREAAVIEAQRHEQELEAEVARLEAELERLHQTLAETEDRFHRRRDELMEAKRHARMLERGDL